MRLKTIFVYSVIFSLLAMFLSSCVFLQKPRVVRYVRYQVKSDDTLPAISQRFEVSEKEILAYNGFSSAKEIRFGSVIKIPWKKEKAPPVTTKPSSGMGLDKLPRDPASLRIVTANQAKKYMGALAWPTKAGEVSSLFGRRWLSFHEGIDVRAPEGTPIYAAHSGKVVYSGDGLRGYGNLVIIRGDGLMTIYAHNSRNRVRVGMDVAKGAFIAEVGETGKSTGPHLHFETRVRDSKNANAAVDPLVFFIPPPVKKDAVAATKADKEKSEKEKTAQAAKVAQPTPTPSAEVKASSSSKPAQDSKSNGIIKEKTLIDESANANDGKAQTEGAQPETEKRPDRPSLVQM